MPMRLEQMWRFSIMFVLLSCLLLPGASAEDPTPTPSDSRPPSRRDCSAFSMEGIKPGMTVQQVEEQGIEVKARKAFVPAEQKGKLFRFRGEKHDGDFKL